MKIIKIKSCMDCQYFEFNQKVGVFTCIHPECKKFKNGFAIIERDIALDGKLPPWCPLEDYKE